MYQTWAIEQTDLAGMVGDACRLLAIKQLIEQIERVSPTLAAEALAQAADRIRRERWRLELSDASHSSKLTRAVAAITNVSPGLAAKVFAPSGADLVADELSRFIVANKIERGRR